MQVHKVFHEHTRKDNIISTWIFQCFITDFHSIQNNNSIVNLHLIGLVQFNQIQFNTFHSIQIGYISLKKYFEKTISLQNHSNQTIEIMKKFNENKINCQCNHNNKG